MSFGLTGNVGCSSHGMRMLSGTVAREARREPEIARIGWPKCLTEDCMLNSYVYMYIYIHAYIYKQASTKQQHCVDFEYPQRGNFDDVALLSMQGTGFGRCLCTVACICMHLYLCFCHLLPVCKDYRLLLGHSLTVASRCSCLGQCTQSSTPKCGPMIHGL